ncbi:hypothetical protein GCM10023144_15530 [Pigmentiphaga soli]|uniref:Uncharacterized protein n=1 Tax=Pigmentiphaga soli TaxID=1007095 RepID=A0ABP8GSL7_9BURK
MPWAGATGRAADGPAAGEVGKAAAEGAAGDDGMMRADAERRDVPIVAARACAGAGVEWTLP